jgi:hypothetical protein
MFLSSASAWSLAERDALPQIIESNFSRPSRECGTTSTPRTGPL